MAARTRVLNLTTQQQQTKTFFDTKASDWDSKAQGKIKNKVNVIAQRNAYVLHVIRHRAHTTHVLDVGSGVGDLVIAIAKMGIKATGIDIAGGMIDLAHRRAIDNKIDLADFITTDYFDFHVPNDSYDLISANGFIEYVSYKQRDDFIEDAFRILSPGGSLVISSRNRLFNLYSANDYTEQELQDDSTKALLQELLAIVRGTRFSELLKIITAPPQPADLNHPDTGIGVSTRYQYTPVQLMQLLSKFGFAIEGLSPIHIHSFIPSLKDHYPAAHAKTATFLQKYAVEQHQFIPNSSAFMLHAKKPV